MANAKTRSTDDFKNCIVERFWRRDKVVRCIVGATELRSPTDCERAMGDTESVDCLAAIQQDHVQSVGGRWEIQSQCVVLQLSSQITYPLWVGNGKYRVIA
jgi:hypothetical protein